MAAGGERLGQLDGLRALSVVAVLLWHFVPASAAILPWGPLGVRLFFVLSGFFTTGILLRCRDLAHDGRARVPFLLRQFYARRALRIVPTYYLALAVAALVDLPPTRATLAWHLAYATNIYVTWTETWPGPLAHVWFLGAQEQFYLLWPALVLLLPRRRLPAVMWGLVLVSPLFRVTCRVLGLWWWLGQYVLLPAAFDGLVLGGLLALVHAGGRPARTPLDARAAGWCAALLVATGQVLRVWWPQGVAAGLSDTCDAFAFTWLVHRGILGVPGLAGRALAWGPLRWLGRVSYGVYVYHPFVLAALPAATAALGVAAPSGVLRFAVLTAVTLLVSAVSWYAIEEPINAYRRHFPFVPSA